MTQEKRPTVAAVRLRMAREAAKKTQAALAAEWSVSATAISEWEASNSAPRDANPFIIESWSREVAAQLARPDLVIRVVDWVSPEGRERLSRLAPSFLEASP